MQNANDDDPLMPMMEVDNDEEADDDDEMVEEEEEEEEEEEAVADTDTNTDRTMEVTQDEIVAAHEIKLSFQQEGGGGGGGGDEEDPLPQRLRPLTDYEYMQYALTTYDETPEQRLHRAHCLQAFREEYNIQDTVEEGVQILDEFSRNVWPGFLLQFEKIRVHNIDIVCMSTNWQYWDPSRIGDSQQKWRLFMGTFYYSLQLRMCNFAAIRIGGRVLAECGDVGHHQYDEAFSARFTHELYGVYPCNHEQLLFLNTPSIMNFGYACFKKYHTKEWQQNWCWGTRSLVLMTTTRKEDKDNFDSNTSIKLRHPKLHDSGCYTMPDKYWRNGIGINAIMFCLPEQLNLT